MRRYLIALSAAAVVALAGCSSSDGDKAEPAGGDVVAAPSSAAPKTAAPRAATSTPPARPAAAVDEQGYLTAVGKIDPGLTVNTSRALRRGRNVCDEIGNGVTGDKLTSYVVQEMSGGNATIDAAQAARVITAARTYLCAG